MKRLRPLSLALIASVAVAWAMPASATGNCANGKLIYYKKVGAVEISCSQSSCHATGVNKNKLSPGQYNPGSIDSALDSVSEMKGLRGTLGLTMSDIDDVATYIFYATTCPASAPNLQAAPAPVTFASTNVGSTTTPITVTVTNSGSASATAIGFSNSNGTEFLISGNTCAGGTVAVGATCGFSVAFKPSAAGARSGTLTLSYNSKQLLIGASGTGAAVATPGQLSMATTMSFATQTVSSTSAPKSVTITNVGGTAVSVSSVASSNPAEFAIASNSCNTVNAGASCSVGVTFQPSVAGARNATITVTSNGVGSPQTISASGTGGAVAAPGQLSMVTALNFASQTVATTSAANSVTVTNIGSTPVSVSGVASSNPAEFAIASNTCATVGAGATCAVGVTFSPSAAGPRSATITLTSNGIGSPQAISASGTGTTGTTPPPTTVTVVEYYHAGFDHYFITSVLTDISALDGGAFGGVWARTGYQFKAYAAAGTGTASVCRFFSTAFAPKSSHFYTPYAFECNGLKTDPGWQYEDSNLVMAMPDANGSCAAGFTPVYRFYNNFQGAAPNHRYTTDLGIKAQMLAKGHTQEGPLPGLAFMCAPP